MNPIDEMYMFYGRATIPNFKPAVPLRKVEILSGLGCERPGYRLTSATEDDGRFFQLEVGILGSPSIFSETPPKEYRVAGYMFTPCGHLQEEDLLQYRYHFQEIIALDKCKKGFQHLGAALERIQDLSGPAGAILSGLHEGAGTPLYLCHCSSIGGIVEKGADVISEWKHTIKYQVSDEEDKLVNAVGFVEVGSDIPQSVSFMLDFPLDMPTKWRPAVGEEIRLFSTLDEAVMELITAYD